MIELNACPKCGKPVVGNVNHYGLNNYRFYVQCSNCCLEWTSRKFNTLVKANHDGAIAWNGNCSRVKYMKGKKND